MKPAGFWADGPSEHRRAVERNVPELRRRLKNCEPDYRDQIAKELDQAVEDLKKSDDRPNPLVINVTRYDFRRYQRGQLTPAPSDARTARSIDEALPGQCFLE